MTRPTMRFVPVKSVAQQDLQALQRVRERLMKARTTLIKETRWLLHEYGIIVPQGAATYSLRPGLVVMFTYHPMLQCSFFHGGHP